MHDKQWKQVMDVERSSRELRKFHIYVDNVMQRCACLAREAKVHLQHLSTRPRFREILYASLIVLASLIFFINYVSPRRSRTPPTRPSTPSIEEAPPREKTKAPDRVPGTWTPSSFVRPTPAPYPDWDIATTKPLPYRPFRYKNFVTMGLRSLPSWDEWIELDSHYPRFHADKARRILERGDKCCKTAPEAM